jgi:hypothetical protein
MVIILLKLINNGHLDRSLLAIRKEHMITDGIFDRQICSSLIPFNIAFI